MRRTTGEQKPGTVLAEVPALDGVVEVTAAWVQDKRERFPHADVLAVVEAYRARCAADPAERVTVWGMERQLTRLIREQGREQEKMGQRPGTRA